ncbi:MAG: response regulator [Chloroflexi bacterium]|nr:response regulator [Chloroflexota bacterium]
MQKGQILIVDDEEDVREVIQDTLEELGFACATAGDYNEACAALSGQHFDLALVDIMMPGKSGVELFQEMARTSVDTGVLFVTARSDLRQAVSVMQSGALDYVIKPVDLSALERTVIRAMEKREETLAVEGARRSLEERVLQQSQLLEARLREIAALNRLLQSAVEARSEIVEVGEQVAACVRETASTLQALAQRVLQVSRLPRSDTEALGG